MANPRVVAKRRGRIGPTLRWWIRTPPDLSSLTGVAGHKRILDEQA